MRRSVRRTLFFLVTAILGLVLVGGLVKTSLDRLPVPSRDGSLDGGISVSAESGTPGADLQDQPPAVLRTRDRARILLERMAAGRPYVFGSSTFYLVLALAYGLVVVALLARIVRAAGEQGGGS